MDTYSLPVISGGGYCFARRHTAVYSIVCVWVPAAARTRLVTHGVVYRNQRLCKPPQQRFNIPGQVRFLWQALQIFLVKIFSKKLSCRREATRCFVYVSSYSFNSTIPQAQSFSIIVTSASDLPLRAIKFCSVVFGVTLRLLAINTSSSVSSEQQNDAAYSLPAMSVTNLPQSGVAVCITLSGRTVDNARDEASYWSRIAIFTYPAFEALVRGLPIGILL